MADLSPAARAVLDAMYQVNMDFSGESAQLAAAALRAVAGSVPKDSRGDVENYATGFRDGIAFSCQFLDELAAELDNSSAPTSDHLFRENNDTAN